jgi:hypothetical protein
MHSRPPSKPSTTATLHSTLALLATLAVTACVSPPRAVGPTTLAGSLPAPREGVMAQADRAPGATDGPLRVLEPRFIWTHASATEATYTWSCTVENPADEGFRVTLVVHLLDRNGRRLAATNQSLQIDGNSRVPVRGEGLLEADDGGAVTSWRLEYWVETSPRAVRGHRNF